MMSAAHSEVISTEAIFTGDFASLRHYRQVKTYFL